MKTIIFDFGNVIGFFDHGRTVTKMAPYTCLTPNDMYSAVYDGDLEDRFERGHLSPLAFLEEARTLWRLRCDIDVLAEAVSDIFTPNPEVCDLIPRLAPNYRILLGSNTNAIHSHKFITQFADVLGHFESLVLSHEIGVRKPEAEFFQHCHRLADAPASQCVFVDDLSANITGARKIGFKTVHYRPNADLAGQLRDLGILMDVPIVDQPTGERP